MGSRSFSWLAWVCLCAGVLGCRSEQGADAKPPAAASASPLAGRVALPAGDSRSRTKTAAAPLQVTRPGPDRRRAGDAVQANKACEKCHQAEAKDWRGSYHQRSNVDAAYRAAFDIEPLPFCRSCHAPEANPFDVPAKAVSELGVGCVSCHVVEANTVLAAGVGRDSLKQAGKAPHRIRYSQDFAYTGACASCHEFTFPDKRGPAAADHMQTTLREHQASPSKATPCASCHMPLVKGRRSHAFARVRDVAWLRENLQVSATLTEHGSLEVVLRQPEPAHGFPTGDLFRRLEVGAELRKAGASIKSERQHLARHFRRQPGAMGRPLDKDNRVFAEPVTLELDLHCGEEAGVELSWWVKYQRVAQVFDGVDPEKAHVESELLLHSGKLCGGT